MNYSQDDLKKQVAQAALEVIQPQLSRSTLLGIGTGSTVDLFIDALAALQADFKGAVSSSERSTERLRAHGIPVFDLNEVEQLGWYIDGADEINPQGEMIKGGGGALTREKIVASVAAQFLCIADESKQVAVLGQFPLPVEVLPMAEKSVGRALAALGARVEKRAGFVTDNGGVILDVHGLRIEQPLALEQQINNIPGVVCCGVFAQNKATLALIGTQQGVIRAS